MKLKILYTITVAAMVAATLGCARDGNSNSKKKKKPATVAFAGLADDQTIGTGTVIAIRYTRQSGAGPLDFYADADGDLTTTNDQVPIAMGVPAGTEQVDWTTAGAPPRAYHIVARGSSGGRTADTVSTGKVIVNAPPAAAFQRPAGDDVASSGNTYRVEFSVDDPDDDARTSVYADGDGNLATTADQFAIVTNIPDDNGAAQSAAWDTRGVPLGSYFIVAESTDPLNGRVTETAGPVEVVENVAALAPLRGNQGTQFLDLRVLPDDSVLVSGALHDSSAPGGVHVARYESDGTIRWAKTATGPGDKSAYAMNALADGSCIVTGVFTDDLLFGAGEANETELVSVGGSFDAFLARYHSDGTLAWAVRAGDGALEVGEDALALDDGSCLWAARFEGTVTLGPGEANETSATSAGSSDGFVARYASDGTLAWALHWGSTGRDAANGIALMPDGSFLVSGYFEGTIVLGAGEANETTLTSLGETDILLARIESDGTLRWARRLGGAGPDGGRRPAVRTDGSFVLAGAFSETVAFDTLSLTSAGETDVFVAGFDGDGKVLFATGFGGASREGARFVVVAADGSLAVTGLVSDSFSVGPFSLGGAGGVDVLTAVFESDGTLRWARSDGGPGEDNGFGVGFRSDGSVVVAGRMGYHTSSTTFGAGEANETTVNSSGGYGGEGFLIRINRDGKF